MHIGVVGGGYWGSKHVRVFAGMHDVHDVTLIEQEPDRRRQLSEAFSSVRCVASLDDVLADLDGVVIATRAGGHVELGLQVLRAGKHALIEKPMATSVASATQLCQEARANAVVLMVGHTFEFNPAVVELKRRLVNGELGSVYYIRSLRLNLGQYQGDVNVIWDLAPHDISIIDYLLDDVPSTVTAWGHHSVSKDFEDVGMLRLQYRRSEVDAYVHVSWLDPSKTREVTVVGSEKMAIYDDLKSEERLKLFDRGVSLQTTKLHEAPMTYRYGDVTSPFIDFEEPLALENAHFVNAIRTGRATKATGETGRDVVAVLEATQRSLELGRPVDLCELTEPLVDVNGAIAGTATGNGVHRRP